METANTENKYSLIVAVVNLGFAEKATIAAREAGAAGGTVVHARRAGSGKDKSFFGISINTEKEIVTILTPTGKKTDIMKNIGAACGITTEAHGIVFSVPAEDAALCYFDEPD